MGACGMSNQKQLHATDSACHLTATNSKKHRLLQICRKGKLNRCCAHNTGIDRPTHTWVGVAVFLAAVVSRTLS
jgi:hypothetical protein